MTMSKDINDRESGKFREGSDGGVKIAVIPESEFNIGEYDYISVTYTGDNLTGVIYKLGGSGGTIVATLTLAYTGSNLTSVTKT